jgi:hypothetical protein
MIFIKKRGNHARDRPYSSLQKPIFFVAIYSGNAIVFLLQFFAQVFDQIAGGNDPH